MQEEEVTASGIADMCVQQTRADEMSRHAKRIALAAIAVYPEGEVRLKEYKRAIAKKVKEDKRCGFIFTMIVLPIIISVISQWLVKWFMNRRKTDWNQMKAQAEMSLS